MLDMNYCDSNAIPTTHLSLWEINQQNQKFWEKQNRLTATRMSDAAISQVALQELQSEALRSVPLYSRKTLEMALEDAERVMALERSEFARRGGRALKPDALQQFIIKHVRRRRSLTESKLLELLTDDRGIFQMNEEEVYFYKPNGAQRSAPLRSAEH